MMRHFCMENDFVEKLFSNFDEQSSDDPFFDLGVDHNRLRGSLSSSSSVSSEGDQSSSKTPSTSSQRYKTELCRQYSDSGQCRYGRKCQFAHGSNDLRTASRHPKYKTETCRTFHSTGFCPYGSRCHFMHDEVDSVPSSPSASVKSHTKSSSSCASDTEAMLSSSKAEQLQLVQLISQLIITSRANEAMQPCQAPQLELTAANRKLHEMQFNNNNNSSIYAPNALPPLENNSIISQLAFNLNALNSNRSVSNQPKVFSPAQQFSYSDLSNRAPPFNFTPC